MLLSELLSGDRVRVPLSGRTKNEILAELAAVVAGDGESPTASAILGCVVEREQVLSTGIGGGVAIPHGKCAHVDQLMLAAGVAREPIEYDALDGKPVQLFFLLVGPESAAGAHVKVLSRISRLLRRDQLRTALIESESPAAFMRLVTESEQA